MKELRVRLSDGLYNELVDQKDGLPWSKFIAELMNKPSATSERGKGGVELVQDLNDSLQSVLGLAAGTLPEDVVVINICKNCHKFVRSESNTKPFEFCPYCGEEDDLVCVGADDEEDENKEEDEEKEED